ncbi:MAG TPA: hypothetical protein VG710_00505, partial [Opitutus sp.]|nr:hypothetical protein [Opitutus sp.]
SLIKTVTEAAGGRGWLVNGRNEIGFDRAPAKQLLSTYEAGDASLRLQEEIAATGVTCPVSMATAVALFPVGAGRVTGCGAGSPDPAVSADRLTGAAGSGDPDLQRETDGAGLEVRVPIYDELEPKRRPFFRATESWSGALASLAKLRIGDGRVQRLYDLARANLVLHTPGEVYPGPYTYKRFWFRDAVFVLNALLTLGGIERTRRALREFAPRQRHDGYFLSQEGEWDSNGEALWFYRRFGELTGEAPPAEWLEAVAKGARWISRKRLPREPARPEAGLLPAGFSAEHLGPNDFYYWDDFWGVAGLRAAAEMLRGANPKLAEACVREAEEFLETIRRSFPHGPQRRFPGAIPASPHRRMDSGAVGSLVADYPLQLFPAGDPGISRTADYLCGNCLQSGGFFQDMIHSGINAYLTLHLAQVRLRAGDATAAWALMDAVARLASPTGQWPEAIHPLTFGGCMGDGQHIWAAAEWLMLVRNLFVREEGGVLVIGTGVRPEWLRAGEAAFGPTLTRHGRVTVRLAGEGSGVRATVEGTWRGAAPRREICVPGCAPIAVPAGEEETDFFLRWNEGGSETRPN